MKKEAKAKDKKVIMLVDDNPDLLYSVQKGLESLGDYKVITVESGRKCLQLLKDITPDLILLDIMMPRMDGWDTCAKIKDNKKTENIPIVFLTAKTDPISKSMGSLASADYITKPFDMKDLKKRIDSAVK
ncbi:MAG: response regulator [Nanoarchaeota archaeon]